MAGKSVIDVKILGDNKGLSDSLADSEEQIGAFAGNAGKLAAGAALGVGVAAAAGLTKGFIDGLAQQDIDATLGAQLGVTAGRAAELGDVAGSLYRDAWGSSLDEVAASVAAVESTLGDSIDPAALEPLTEQALALAQAFEVDTASAVSSVGVLLKSGLVADADEAFDLIARGLQEMPAGVRDELLEASDEYGQFFAALGFNGEQAFGLLTTAAADGMYGIDKTGDAIKEFGIRATDLSDSSSSAYDSIGLSQAEMTNALLAGGDTAKAAFDQIVTGLLGIEDPGKRAESAIALFGTPIEDLGVNEIPAFLESLVSVGDGLTGVEGAAEGVADTLGGTTSGKIESFKRKALGGLADFAVAYLIPAFESVVAWFEQNWPTIQVTIERVFNWLTVNAWPVVQQVALGIQTAFQAVVGWFEVNWPTIQRVIESVVTWLTTVAWPAIQQIAQFIQTEFSNVVAWFEVNWPKIQTTIQGVLDAVQIIIETWIGIVKALWQKWGEDLVNLLINTWEAIKTIVQAAVDIVRGIIDTVTSLIKGDWSGVWEGIKTIFRGVWDAIVGILDIALGQIKFLLTVAWEVVKLAFTTVWDGISSFMSDIWDGIVGFVSDGIDKVVGFITGLPGRIASGIGSGFDSLWESFKSVINRIIDGINSVNLPGVTIGGWDPPGPGPTIPSFTTPGLDPFPYIGRLHSGGLVPGRGEMVAILEGGERVLSRDQTERYDSGSSIVINHYGPSLSVDDIGRAYRMVRLSQ